jgi:hypothetical protein
MTRWWRDNDPSPRRAGRNRRLEFDTMEGRMLLSAGPSRVAIARVTALEDARLLSTQARSVQEEPSSPTVVKPTVGNQVSFAWKTYSQGKSMAISPKVRDLGVKYAKVVFSPDTREVGLAYLRAAIRGNSKTMNQLSHTKLVQKVSHEFDQISHSPFVKKVGQAFSSFGKSVASQFDRLFLHKSSNPAPKKAT